MPNRSRVSSSRARTAGRHAVPGREEPVGRAEVGGLGGQRAQRGDEFVVQRRRRQQCPPSAPSAPRSAPGYSAARRSATAIGPPAPKPARSALLSTTSVGRCDADASIARSSGLTASATTTTSTSASSSSATTHHPGTGQRGRHRAPTHAVSPTNRNPERAADRLDERGHPRITCSLREPCQLGGENLVAFPGRRLAHAHALVVPHAGSRLRPPPQMVASPWPLCERLFSAARSAAIGNCWVSICTTMRVRSVPMRDHGRMHAQRWGTGTPSPERRR